VSLSEILFLGILGLVVFGPKKLVEVGQHVGRALAAFRKATEEFKSQLGSEIATADKRTSTLPAEHGSSSSLFQQGEAPLT
jgi:TatA/E family protein of Tat protein translocase